MLELSSSWPILGLRALVCAEPGPRERRERHMEGSLDKGKSDLRCEQS
jgi:hypothetical protein